MVIFLTLLIMSTWKPSHKICLIFFSFVSYIFHFSKFHLFFLTNLYATESESAKFPANSFAITLLGTFPDFYSSCLHFDSFCYFFIKFVCIQCSVNVQISHSWYLLFLAKIRSSKKFQKISCILDTSPGYDIWRAL